MIENEHGIVPPQMLFHRANNNNDGIFIEQRHRRQNKRQKQYAYINSKSRIFYALLVLGPGSIYIPAMNDDFRTTLFLMHLAIPTSPSFWPYSRPFERM